MAKFKHVVNVSVHDDALFMRLHNENNYEARILSASSSSESATVLPPAKTDTHLSMNHRTEIIRSGFALVSPNVKFISNTIFRWLVPSSMLYWCWCCCAPGEPLFGCMVLCSSLLL